MFTTFRASPKRPRQISPIEDAIADIKAGKMVVLMDDENRENEGDLCMAASKATPAAINFMAKYGRGLICFALTEERIDELGLVDDGEPTTAPRSARPSRSRSTPATASPPASRRTTAP